MNSKSELRQRALSARRSIPKGELAELSRAIEARLYRLAEYNEARTIATYVAMADEVQTLPMIVHSLGTGKRILVPKTDSAHRLLIFSELHDIRKELAPAQSGILEPLPEFLRPVDLNEAELIMVPLVACDERGYRLGYGKGYFDRALLSLRSGVTTIGLALEVQMVAEIPAESHDVPLMMIITEHRTMRTDRQRALTRGAAA
jgi:5-formyltetrahydrofolate cyclo-ligase